MRYGLRYLVPLPIYITREYDSEQEAIDAMKAVVLFGLSIGVQDGETRVIPSGQILSMHPYPIDDEEPADDEQPALPETE